MTMSAMASSTARNLASFAALVLLSAAMHAKANFPNQQCAQHFISCYDTYSGQYDAAIKQAQEEAIRNAQNNDGNNNTTTAAMANDFNIPQAMPRPFTCDKDSKLFQPGLALVDCLQKNIECANEMNLGKILSTWTAKCEVMGTKMPEFVKESQKVSAKLKQLMEKKRQELGDEKLQEVFSAFSGMNLDELNPTSPQTSPQNQQQQPKLTESMKLCQAKDPQTSVKQPWATALFTFGVLAGDQCMCTKTFTELVHAETEDHIKTSAELKEIFTNDELEMFKEQSRVQHAFHCEVVKAVTKTSGNDLMSDPSDLPPLLGGGLLESSGSKMKFASDDLLRNGVKSAASGIKAKSWTAAATVMGALLGVAGLFL